MPSGFTVSNGQIIDPNGNVWHGDGIGVYDSQASSGGAATANTILKEFPGINLVRVANYSFGTPASYAAFTNTLTQAGVAVVFEDHNTDVTVLTGSALTAESNWYASMASYYASNPYVMFQTMNEPGAGDADQMLATYNAIRGTGNNTIVFMEAGAGADGNTSSLGDTSVFATMHNVAWDMHTYNWQSQYSTSVSSIQSDQSNRLSVMHALHSADGVMPVATLEDGNSTNGINIDPGGSQEIQASFTKSWSCRCRSVDLG